MKCPVCPESNLLMTERQGVEIDYCPKCRGVWLDRGELDKLIERSAVAPAVAAAAAPVAASPYPAPRYEEHRPSHHGDYGHDQRRKKSWLSEIFD